MTAPRPSPALTGPVIRGIVFLASFVVVVAGLRAAAPILTPLALAVFIAAISLPVLEWLRRRRVPVPVAIFAVVLMNAAVLVTIGWIILQSVTELRAELPMYIARAREVESAVRARLMMLGIDVAPTFRGDLLQPQRLLDLLALTARKATSAATGLLLLLLYLVFILAESVALPEKVRRVLGPDGRGVEGAAATLREVQRYLVLKTMISLVTGVAIGAGAWFLGVDFALFWGFLAFALNFIPAIGSVVAAIPTLLVALLQLGPATAIVLGGIILAVNIVIGNFADPILIGRQLRLSPIIVLVSLVFWGWTWGIIGGFLAVPLTIALRIGLEHTTSLSRYADLMGPVPPDPPAA